MSTHHQPRLNGRVAGPDGGPVGWMDASYLEVHVQSIGDRRVRCWSVGELSNDQMELATEQLPPPFPLFLQKPPRTGSLPSAPPSHVPPAAPPAVAAAAGGLTGVGGGADMVDDRRGRFERTRPRVAHFYWH